MKITIGYYILIFLPLLIVSCKYKYVKTYDEESNYPAYIEGSYHAPKVLVDYFPVFPAIYLNEEDGQSLKLGSVIDKNEDGVFFLTSKTQLFIPTETIFYPFEKINNIVDSSGKCTYGEIPSKYFSPIKMEIVLEYLDDGWPSEVILELEPGKTFSYCIYPGAYLLANINLLLSNDAKLKLSVLPEDTIIIQNKMANYIGDIVLEPSVEQDSSSIRITTEPKYEVDNMVIAGFLFGLVGLAVYAIIADASDENYEYLNFKIQADSNYKAISMREINQMKFLKNKKLVNSDFEERKSIKR